MRAFVSVLGLGLGLLLASCAGGEQEVIARPPPRPMVLPTFAPPPEDVATTPVVERKGRGASGMDRTFAPTVAVAAPVVRPTIMRPRPPPH